MFTSAVPSGLLNLIVDFPSSSPLKKKTLYNNSEVFCLTTFLPFFLTVTDFFFCSILTSNSPFSLGNGNLTCNLYANCPYKSVDIIL